MKISVCVSWFLFSLSVQASSLSSFKDLSGRLDIAGGSAHIPVMQELAQTIMSYHPKIKITIDKGGSGVGVQKLASRLVDIGNTGRPLTKDEQEKHNLLSYEFAIDEIALIVHPTNPITKISSEQAKDLFLGKKKTWEALGSSAPLHLLFVMNLVEPARSFLESLTFLLIRHGLM